MLKTLAAAFVVALAVVGLATAANSSETYKFKSTLTAGAEVPKPKGVPASATGSLARRDPAAHPVDQPRRATGV